MQGSATSAVSVGMGGPLNGLLFSNNSGQTWALFNAPNLTGVNISGLVARGNGVVVVSGNSFTFNTQESTSPGLYRPASTTNPNPGGGGPNAIINIAGNGTSGLPRGDYTDVVNAPGNLMRNVHRSGQYDLGGGDRHLSQHRRRADMGPKVCTAPPNTVNIRLSGRDNTFAGPSTVFGAIVTGASNFPAQLNQVVRTANDGTSWQNMNMPSTGEAGGPFGIHPGGQGQLHLSIVADPTTADVVYIGGDRQPAVNDGANNASFPTPGANDYTGRLFRGTFDPGTSNTAWAAITHNQTNSGNAPGSAPHAGLAFHGVCRQQLD